MAKIKEGGAVPKIDGEKIETIGINADGPTTRKAQLWINESSLSFLTIDELLDLKEEINQTLQEIIN